MRIGLVAERLEADDFVIWGEVGGEVVVTVEEVRDEKRDRNDVELADERDRVGARGTRVWAGFDYRSAQV